MILVNQIKINSQKKVLTFLIINFFVLFIVTNSFVQFLELLIVLFCGLYLFSNCYAIRYSSLRIKILNDIIKSKKITSEEQLYNDRIKRFKKNNKTLMDKRAFTLFNSVNNIFRKFFI